MDGDQIDPVSTAASGDERAEFKATRSLRDQGQLVSLERTTQSTVSILTAPLFGLLLLGALVAPAQVESGPGGYTLPVRVDEVSVVFSASDFEGVPIDDLKLS